MEVNMSRRARSDTKLESFQSELDDHNVLMYMYQHVFCKWMIMLMHYQSVKVVTVNHFLKVSTQHFYSTLHVTHVTCRSGPRSLHGKDS